MKSQIYHIQYNPLSAVPSS